MTDSAHPTPSARPPRQPRTGTTGTGARKAGSKSGPSRAREFALQALYQHLVGGNDATAIDVFTRDLSGFHKADSVHFDALLHGCTEQGAALDALIVPLLDRPLAEISPIERSVMWIGVFLAAALCLGLGILINETTGEFPQKEQELFEGIVAVIAVVILTWMVFWMRKVSRNVKVQLEQAVDNALQRGNNHGWALVMMVFFAVAREGLESVFFLLAAFHTST